MGYFVSDGRTIRQPSLCFTEPRHIYLSFDDSNDIMGLLTTKGFSTSDKLTKYSCDLSGETMASFKESSLSFVSSGEQLRRRRDL